MRSGRTLTGKQVREVPSGHTGAVRAGGGQVRKGQGFRESEVGMSRDAAQELWALLTDQDGDADEDLLDEARGFLDRPRHVPGGVVVRFDDRERRMVVRAIDDWDLEFGTLIKSAARKLETALRFPSPS